MTAGLPEDPGVPHELAEARDEIARLKELNLKLLQALDTAQAAVAEAVMLFEFMRDGDDFSAIVEGIEAYLAAHGDLGAERF